MKAEVKRVVARRSENCELCSAKIEPYRSYFLILEITACCECARSILEDVLIELESEMEQWPTEVEI